MVKRLLLALIVAASSAAFAGQAEQFCAGFAEGFKTVKGSGVMVPM